MAYLSVHSKYKTSLDYIFAFYLLVVKWGKKSRPTDMTIVEIFNIQEAGSDYLLLAGMGTHVRVNFDKDKDFTKEENAAFFRGLEGKPAAIPADLNEPFFIAVDFWRSPDNSLRVVPFPFAVSSIELDDKDARRRLILCPVHRIQMRETAEADVPGVLFFYCPNPAGCDRRYSKEAGHITIDDLPCRT
jgi:hypothetical protein